MRIPKRAMVCCVVGTLCIIAGCARSSATSVPMSPSPTFLSGASSVTATAPILTPPATQRRTPEASNTPPVTSSPTPSWVSASILTCAGSGIPAPFPDGQVLPGEIIFRDGQDHGFYRMGGSPLRQEKLSYPGGDKAASFGLSTDGKWLAFAPIEPLPTISGAQPTKPVELLTPKLALLSADGVYREYPLDFGSQGYSDGGGTWPIEWIQSVTGYWINDELLYVWLNFHNPTDVYSRGLAVPRLWDAFNQTWVEGPFDLVQDRWVDNGLSFSPDMQRVMYESTALDARNGVMLRDAETGAKIWADSEFHYDPRAVFGWANDSSKVAVSDIVFHPERADRIVIIDRNGASTVIADASFSNQAFRVFELKWSPDGRFLAWSATFDDQSDLYVFDAVANAYLYHCPVFGYHQWALDLAWSPDGKYIAMAANSVDKPMPLRVLEVRTGLTFELLPDAKLVGWSTKFGEAASIQP